MLVYTTPPLDEEVEVTGPITAKLYAATSARDTDWMVRLVDVQPDGYSAMLCEGLMRARHRDPERDGAFNPDKLSVIEPNRVYEYTIEFWRATANVFAKGHRIRVEISSSYFPYYLRNLNTGADNIGLETSSRRGRAEGLAHGRASIARRAAGDPAALKYEVGFAGELHRVTFHLSRPAASRRSSTSSPRKYAPTSATS